MSKFKIKDIVEDDCGCIYEILKVGRKYYTCKGWGYCGYSVKEFSKFKVEIKTLDSRAKLQSEQ